MHAKLLTYIWSDLASTPSNASLAAEELLACGGGRKRVLNARPHCGSSAVQPAMPSQTDGTRSESATAVTHVPPKGPAGMSFVALPAPIASTLPPPTVIEPLLAQSSSEREMLMNSAVERRRELTEAGQVLNRVVYDSVAFVPASADRVPGGALLFESRFESGNLRRVVHVHGNEYDLLLNWDHGTRGHTQWYFFAVCNPRLGERYTFNIVNFKKPESLYKSGMRPLVYSASAASKHGHGWTRAGSDVNYYTPKDASHSTLTFSWTAEHENDTLYFAMCYPYTYSDLRAYLARVQADPLKARHVRRQRKLAGAQTHHKHMHPGGRRSAPCPLASLAPCLLASPLANGICSLRSLL